MEDNSSGRLGISDAPWKQLPPLKGNALQELVAVFEGGHLVQCHELLSWTAFQDFCCNELWSLHLLNLHTAVYQFNLSIMGCSLTSVASTFLSILSPYSNTLSEGERQRKWDAETKAESFSRSKIQDANVCHVILNASDAFADALIADLDAVPECCPRVA